MKAFPYELINFADDLLRANATPIRGFALTAMGTTIKDIAKQANCSMSTVSRVINNSGYVGTKTRKRVESVIKELNFIPSAMATQLSRGKNNILGVIIPEIDNPFFSGIIKGINEVSHQKGYNVILCDSEEDVHLEEKLIQTLKRQRVSGLLITSALREHQDPTYYMNMLNHLDMPVVLIDREIHGASFDYVCFDDEKAIYDVTTLLIQNGHRHIEMLAGNPDLILGQNRARGYKKAYAYSKLPYKEQWMHYSLFTKEAGYTAMKEILSTPKHTWPTAVVTNNNMLTLGALRAIFEKNLSIPQDISLAGYDRIEVLEYLQLNITLAEKDTVEMGRAAAELLTKRITHGSKSSPPQKITMLPKLVARGSERLLTHR